MLAAAPAEPACFAFAASPPAASPLKLLAAIRKCRVDAVVTSTRRRATSGILMVSLTFEVLTIY
jgi:hypothetical protein